MVALEGGAPIREDLLEVTTLEVWLDELLRRVSQTHAVQGRIKRRPDIVQRQLATYANGELATVLLELPSVNRARRWKPKVDAIVIRQLLGTSRRGTPREVIG